MSIAINLAAMVVILFIAAIPAMYVWALFGNLITIRRQASKQGKAGAA